MNTASERFAVGGAQAPVDLRNYNLHSGVDATDSGAVRSRQGN